LEDGEVDQLAAILMRAGVREWWGSLEDPEHTREGLDNDGAAFAIANDGALGGWLGYNEETDPDHRHGAVLGGSCPDGVRIVLKCCGWHRQHSPGRGGGALKCG
jgi:hypothetical protein